MAKALKQILDKVSPFYQNIGSWFYKGGKYADEIAEKQAAFGRISKNMPITQAGTDELMRRAALLNGEVAELQGKIARNQRRIGFGASLVPVAAGGTALLWPTDDEGSRAYKKELADLERAKQRAAAYKKNKVAEDARDARAKQSATSEKEKGNRVWNGVGITGLGTLTGGSIGAAVDRRNRLRGFLIGSLIAGTATAAGYKLYDKYRNS